MLRIIQQTSSAAARSYYSTADYFTEGQELEGVWRGKGAALLGLEGTVRQKDWDALCDNTHPQTGRQLTLRRNETRRVGWDFNFSVPKSVSLLYAMTQDERILHAFEQAVDETMRGIESDLSTRIRKGGRNSDRETGNGVWGRFVHFTSRPVGGVPDPQLHAHCFLFNSTLDGEEGRWKAAQVGSIKRDGNYFSALMHSRLAASLVELGVPVERTAKGWQVAGVGPETEAKFSRRTQQIDAAAERLGITDPEEKAALGTLTRDGKNKRLTMPELRAEWRSRLTPEESDTFKSLGAATRTPAEPDFSPQAAHDAVVYAAAHHFERESVVPERLLLTTALHQSIGRATPQMVLDADWASYLIRGRQEGRPMVTSPLVLAEEQRMIAFARAGRGAGEPLVPEPIEPSRTWLNPGQRRALDHLCSSRDRVILLRGAAGAGKTSLLKEAVEHIEAHGTNVHVFAPSSQASRDVLRKEGFAEAETVAHLLTSPDARAATEGGVILIDEAGLLGTRTMAKVFELAKERNARVILSGDRYQHGSVERGSALRLLEQEAGLKSAQLTDIVRQRDEYRQAVAYLSQGRVGPGMSLLDKLHWVHEIEDPAQRYDRIAAEYVQATEAGKSVIVVSPTHSESAKVTAAIRGGLRREGKLGPNEHRLLKLTSKKLTAAQKRDRVNYANGDIVVFTQNAPGVRKGTRLTVGTDAIDVTIADRFEVYSAGELAVASGDLIRVTCNAKTADGHRVSNGQTYTVSDIASDGTLTLGNGWRLGPQFGQLDHGYCSTSHAAQGKTKDVVILAEATESFPAASREQLYVSVSRGRSRCSIYTDDHAGLLEAVSGSTDRLTATELTQTLLQRARIHEQSRLPDMPPTSREYARSAELGL